jgi:hypothetical protein
MNYYSIEFPKGQTEVFESDRAINTNEELIALAKEHSKRAKSNSTSFIIGVWENPERTLIKRFFAVNQKSKLSDIQYEYVAALAWQQLTSERFDYFLKQLPEYDENDHDNAVICEEAVDKQVGFSHAISYLTETENRLLEEAQRELSRLPAYAAQASTMEMLFEKAGSDLMVRRKMVDLAAKTKY